MKRLFLSMVVGALVASVMAAGCSQPAPAPAPTQPPAAKPAEPTKAPAAAPAPTKAPEPTKPAAPAPTAAPKVDYPAKGKSVTMIVPFAAGGPIDLGARVMAGALEKELGVPFPVVNKPGASTQIAVTELVNSKPDGYTLLATGQASNSMTYIDPTTKATYGRKDILPIVTFISLPNLVAVGADRPYKTLKDLIDDGKANREKVKLATAGVLSSGNYPVFKLEVMTGAKFTYVNFNSGAEAATAMMGGHADGALLNIPASMPSVKAGQARVIALFSKQPSKFLPGVKTAEEQGYKVYGEGSTGLAAPAGTPKEVVDILNQAVKKIVATDDFKKKMDELSADIWYLDTAQTAAYWDELEAFLKEVLPLIPRG